MQQLTRCQRPERAYFISTEARANELLREYGVNALNGLTSFLPTNSAESNLLAEVCQRPERAYFISTLGLIQHIYETIMCQRPERAYFISTWQGRHYQASS